MVFGLGNRRKVRVDTGSDGVKVVNMVEGAGIFVCHKHDFATENKAEYDDHIKEEGHEYAGGSVGKCVMCNKPGVSIEGLSPEQNPICDTCTLKLADQAATTRKKLAAMREK